MTSAVVTARIKNPVWERADSVLIRAGITPNGLIGALYAWIADTGEIPEGCLVRLDAKPSTTMDAYMSLLESHGASSTGQDLTPAQMQEALYG